MSFACPACANPTKVTDTRTTMDRCRRLRSCTVCNHTFATEEFVAGKRVGHKSNPTHNYRAIVRAELRRVVQQLLAAAPGQAIPMPADVDPIALVTIDG